LAVPGLLFRFHRHDLLTSSNDEAKRLAQAGALEGSMVVAGQQTAGRGRRGRNWESPPGNLYCSLLLRPATPPAEAALLSFVAALALADAAAAFVPAARLALKWPNDVLLDGRKLAGILLESAGENGRTAWLVVGMGVNLASAPPDAASLAAAAGRPVEPEAILACLTDAFAFWYGRWHEAGFPPIRQAWLARAAGLGVPLTVRLAEATFVGRFGGMSETGQLLLEQPGGVRRVEAGEVYLPAPA